MRSKPDPNCERCGGRGKYATNYLPWVDWGEAAAEGRCPCTAPKQITVYELHFEFRVRDNWPAAAVLIAFRKTADEVIFLLNYLGRDKLVDIRLTTMEQ